MIIVLFQNEDKQLVFCSISAELSQSVSWYPSVHEEVWFQAAYHAAASADQHITINVLR